MLMMLVKYLEHAQSVFCSHALALPGSHFTRPFLQFYHVIIRELAWYGNILVVKKSVDMNLMSGINAMTVRYGMLLF